MLPNKTTSILICVTGLGLSLSNPAYADMLFNLNLISNSGAEAGIGTPHNNIIVPVPNWTSTGGFTVVQYRTPPCNLPCLPGLPELDDPGSPNRGVNMFAGGSNDFTDTHGNQIVSVANMSSIIDSYTVPLTMSGWFGGYLGNTDYALLTATFESAGGASLGTVSVGSVMNSERIDSNGNYYTGLLFRTTTGYIPTGTRLIDFQLTMHGYDGSQNDGFADDLAFFTSDPRVATPEPASIGTMLFGLTAFGVFLRRKAVRS